jgi:PAS domain S-box-containing protein
MKDWLSGDLAFEAEHLLWIAAGVILALALGYGIFLQSLVARQLAGLSNVIDALVYALLGALTALLCISWIGRRRRQGPEANQRLASLIRDCPEAIVWLDGEGHIQSWNRGAEFIFGYRPREVIGHPFQELLGHRRSEQASFDAIRLQLLEEGQVRMRELEMRTKAGGTIVARLSGSLLPDGHKHASECALVVTDITAIRRDYEQLRTLYADLEAQMRERTSKLELARYELEMRNAELHRAYQELKDLDRLKSDFVSMVSHELRSPLTNISGAIELMLEEEELSEEYVRKMLGVLGDQTQRLIRLVKGVLDVSRIEAGRLHLERKELDVLPVIRRVVDSLQPTTVFHWFELPPLDLCPPVWGDEDRIEQMIFNLLDNAIKFSPSGGPIGIDLEVGDQEITLSITDPGVGIPADKLDRIFRKFHRLDSHDSRDTYGHGLGLYISRGLAEAHGGRIWVQSTEGQGSTFSFTLPLAAKSRLARHETPRTATPSVEGP